jgi:hypothetical protein
MTFRVGQKIVCVREIEIETPQGTIYGGPVPVLDEIYTVTGFGDTRMQGVGDIVNADCGVVVAELHGPRARMKSTKEWTELCWPIAIFNPLETRETDISAFTAMLTPNKQRVEA